jgi:hypothetical protein
LRQELLDPVISPPESMHLNLKLPNGGRSIMHGLSEETTIEELKESILLSVDDIAPTLHLTFEGKALENGKTLGDYGISMDAEIVISTEGQKSSS